ncbi:MAG: hypothetical protein QOJ65_2339 [Fimbriimonadaceae bacterium]|nr:hypothetical protein [Fimbriimonadaceae bacterium]
MRHAGVWVEWGSPMAWAPYGSDEGGTWHGFQAVRKDFDSILLKRAKDSGVVVFAGARGISPIVCGDRVEGVLSTRGPILAALTIDAAGHRHWLSRQLGLAPQVRSRRLIAEYEYVKEEAALGAPTLNGLPTGWQWQASVGRGRRAVVRVDLAGSARSGAGKRVDVTWRSCSASGKGWRLAGDASVVLDPSSSHGVLMALMSGIGAVSMPAEDYARFLAQWFDYNCKRLSKYYGQIGINVE